MISYAIKRLLLFLPTILLVSILAFALSNMSGGDSTADTLSLQGMESEMDGYDVAYQRQYKKDGLNKPLFYMGIRSNYVHHDIEKIATPAERKFVQTLVDERYSSTYVLKIIQQLIYMRQKQTLPSSTINKLVARADMRELKVEFSKDRYTDSKLASLLLEAEEHKYKYHYPVAVWHGMDNRYHHWISSLIQGDYGVSKLDGRPASHKIWSSLRWTLLIVTINVIITLLLSIPYGLYTGLHVGGWFDRWSSNVLFAIFAMPTFWIATLMVMFFTSEEFGMRIFPGVGIWYQSGETTFWEMIASKWTMLILPIGIIVLKDLAYLGRMVRDTVAGESKKQYALTALSKGSTYKRYAWRHILPNALGPTITLSVGAIPGALGGTLLMEVIFNIPGMGRLLYTSIGNADWNVVFPIVLLTAVVTVFWYFIGDVLIAILNPKLEL